MENKEAYAADTASLLKEKAGEGLRSQMSRDRSFPRGPAGKSVVINHMHSAGYADCMIAEAEKVLNDYKVA